MTFTSYSYILFLVIAVLIARLTRGTLREYVLLGASLVYYAAWDLRFVPVLLSLGAFTYWAGQRVTRERGQLRVLAVPIIIILLVLAYFKYTGMLVELANVLLPRGATLAVPAIILPLGISFYTFECISYLIDVYKGEQPLQPFRRFLLFPAFWPHMVAGPILRIKEFAPQLDHPKPVSANHVLSGVDRIIIGLFKKTVLANSLAPFVDQGFSQGSLANSAVDNWALAIAFALQIYFDFSSYTDIAIGSARLVGFTFPENFNLPYHAKSPNDFWTRWHMTLSRWIRDYLFFPLNVKAGRRVWLRYVYLVLVMAIVGLWHGPGLGFIAWGVWHGVLMVGHRLIEPKAKRWPAAFRRPLALVGRLGTLGLVIASWILFRSPTIGQSLRMLTSMFTLDGLKPSYSVNDYLFVVLCMLEYVLLEPLFKRIAERDPHSLTYRFPSFWLRPLAYGLAIDMVFMFDKSNVAFIYFQF
jgi:alginate O-acetyltransferase complex protein AlgI